eukprot:TRINITY_DN57009_c0_g1_i1.p1 TRINITY_DN57009_c0_g1~~TRINITY_DN57009_c0_g1_i1.p1  ORF type:complete len:524 (+),score=44.36 TRINITY_DN57009_c0_g1_i1:36-1574(+)
MKPFIVAIVAGGASALALLCIAFFVWRYYRSQRPDCAFEPEPNAPPWQLAQPQTPNVIFNSNSTYKSSPSRSEPYESDALHLFSHTHGTAALNRLAIQQSDGDNGPCQTDQRFLSLLSQAGAAGLLGYAPRPPDQSGGRLHFCSTPIGDDTILASLTLAQAEAARLRAEARLSSSESYLELKQQLLPQYQLCRLYEYDGTPELQRHAPGVSPRIHDGGTTTAREGTDTDEATVEQDDKPTADRALRSPPHPAPAASSLPQSHPWSIAPDTTNPDLNPPTDPISRITNTNNPTLAVATVPLPTVLYESPLPSSSRSSKRRRRRHRKTEICTTSSNTNNSAGSNNRSSAHEKMGWAAHWLFGRLGRPPLLRMRRGERVTPLYAFCIGGPPIPVPRKGPLAVDDASDLSEGELILEEILHSPRPSESLYYGDCVRQRVFRCLGRRRQQDSGLHLAPLQEQRYQPLVADLPVEPCHVPPKKEKAKGARPKSQRVTLAAEVTRVLAPAKRRPANLIV